MELNLGNGFLSVDASQAKIACDQCKRSHRICNKGTPTCARCHNLGIECTRKRTKLKGRFVNEWSRASLVLRPSLPALPSWAEVIEAHPSKPSVKFYLRRYIIPLIVLLPEPIVAIKLLDLSTRSRGPQSNKDVLVKPLRIQYSSASIKEMLNSAKAIFFNTYNPFWPLFSEESFRSRPRSQTLRKIVKQIGLERMTTSNLVKAAMAENGLNPKDLENLPNTLDTLQCFLLVLSDLKAPWVKNVRFKLFCQINGLLSLLGLHLNLTSSPQWLERTLAIYFANIGCYNVSIQQHLSISNDILLDVSPSHLSLTFLQRRIAQGHFPHLSDLIIFFSRQSIYHIFLIYFDVNKELREAFREKAPSHMFCAILTKKAEQMEELFSQGWHRLTCLADKFASHKILLLHSRIALAIAYHYAYIELMKTASFLPPNSTLPLYQSPATTKICVFSLKGLKIAIRNIHLVSKFTYTSYSLSYMFTLIPSVSFILAYIKAFESHYGNADVLYAALSKAKECLKLGLNQPSLRSSTKAYLELIDFFTKLHNNSTFRPSK